MELEDDVAIRYRLSGCFTIWINDQDHRYPEDNVYHVTPPDFIVGSSGNESIERLTEDEIVPFLKDISDTLDIPLMKGAILTFGGININPSTLGWKSFTNMYR